MILFGVLMFTLMILAFITVVGLAVTGSLFIVCFGDVIVCIWLIIWLIRRIFFRKK